MEIFIAETRFFFQNYGNLERLLNQSQNMHSNSLCSQAWVVMDLRHFFFNLCLNVLCSKLRMIIKGVSVCMYEQD